LAPAFIEPIFLKLSQVLPRADQWLYELKFDGFRGQIIKSGENVTILSRNKTDFMKRFERIADAARSIDAKDAMIDGEIVFLADDGRPRFEDLQNFSRRLEHRLFFFAFDLLHLNGKGLISRPIEERKEILRSLVPSDSAIRLADSVDAGPEALIDFAREHRLEGVEAKRARFTL
jgi:bifunctional non-homologous end joining protein LigD